MVKLIGSPIEFSWWFMGGPKLTYLIINVIYENVVYACVLWFNSYASRLNDWHAEVTVRGEILLYILNKLKQCFK